MTTDLTIIADVPEPSPDAQDPDLRPDEIEVGQWFWISTTRSVYRSGEGYVDVLVRWLGCVTDIGSNYVYLQEPHRESREWSSEGNATRVHFEKFYVPVEEGGAACVWVPNATEVLKGYVAHHESRLRALMGKMRQVCTQLGVAPARDILEIEQHKVKLSHNLIEDLEADSLSLIELMLALEEYFDIDIPDEQCENVLTVQTAVDVISAILTANKRLV